LKRCLTRCLLLTLYLDGAFAAPAAAADKFGPEVATLIAEARTEGRLQLSWSGAGFGDNGKYVPEWMAGFNKFYGLDLPYTFTPAPSMVQQAAAVAQAAQSGTPAPSDLFIVGPNNLLTDIDAHAVHAYDWAALGKEIGVDLPAKSIAMDNAAVAFATQVIGITYNKNAVPPDKAPRTLEAVLGPEWKGQIASTPYAAGFNYLAAFSPQWTPAKMEDYVTKLSRQIAGLVRCSEPGPLLNGQFDMLVIECDIASAIVDERRGVPIGYVVPSDGALADLWYMAVPKTSPHPAAGALLALFMLTKDGQALSWEADGDDLSLLPGSHTAEALHGQQSALVTVEDFFRHPEANDYTIRYAKILTGAVPK
jgi:ABC-type Fe3+ transport system substrate-binding protein